MTNAKPDNPYAAPSRIVGDPIAGASDKPPTRARIAVSWIAFCYAGSWMMFLFLYPMLNPLDMRDATFLFKLGTSIGTIVAVLCIHHLAHRWWHLGALLLTTILILMQASIWSGG